MVMNYTQPSIYGLPNSLPYAPGGGTGLGTMNYVPTDVLNSAYQWQTFAPTLAAQLAGNAYGDILRYGSSANSDAAQRAAAAMAANASMRNAIAGAQGGVTQQNTATGGQVALGNASNMADIIKAGMGDIGAMQRLRAQQLMEAQTANNQNRQWLASNLGSGSLFDNIAARFAARGMGGLPAIGGALGMAGGLREVVAPNVQPYDVQQYLNMYKPAQFTPGSMPNFNFSPVSAGGGGGGGGFSMPDINSIFSGLNSTIGGAFNANPIFTGANPDVPMANPNTAYQQPARIPPTATPLGNTASGMTNAINLARATQGDTNPANQATYQLAQTNAVRQQIGLPPLTSMAKGGNLGKTKGAVVGEGHMGEGFRMGTAEMVVPDEKGRLHGKVVPMHKSMYKDMRSMRGMRMMAYGGDLGNDPGNRNRTDMIGSYTGNTGAGNTYSSVVSPYATQRTYSPGTSAGWQRPSRISGTEPPPPAGGTSPEVTINPDGGIKIGASANPDTTGQSAGGGLLAPDMQLPEGAGVLSDLNNLPVLQQLRSGRALPGIYSLPQLSRPEVGIGTVPSPFAAAYTFNQLPAFEKQQALDAYKALFGLQPEEVLWMMNQATPGYRNFQRQAVSF